MYFHVCLTPSLLYAEFKLAALQTAGAILLAAVLRLEIEVRWHGNARGGQVAQRCRRSNERDTHVTLYTGCVVLHPWCFAQKRCRRGMPPRSRGDGERVLCSPWMLMAGRLTSKGAVH